MVRDSAFRKQKQLTEISAFKKNVKWWSQIFGTFFCFFGLCSKNEEKMKSKDTLPEKEKQLKLKILGAQKGASWIILRVDFERFFG